MSERDDFLDREAELMGWTRAQVEEQAAILREAVKGPPTMRSSPSFAEWLRTRREWTDQHAARCGRFWADVDSSPVA